MSPRILHPNGDRTLSIGEVTKTQLAHEVNRQSGLIKQQREQIRLLSRSLAAILHDPDAFRPTRTDGALIPKLALERLPKGGQVTFEETETDWIMRLLMPEAQPAIETPTILVPKG